MKIMKIQTTKHSAWSESCKRCPVPNSCHLEPIAGPYGQK